MLSKKFTQLSSLGRLLMKDSSVLKAQVSVKYLTLCQPARLGSSMNEAAMG